MVLSIVLLVIIVVSGQFSWFSEVRLFCFFFILNIKRGFCFLVPSVFEGNKFCFLIG